MLGSRFVEFLCSQKKGYFNFHGVMFLCCVVSLLWSVGTRREPAEKRPVPAGVVGKLPTNAALLHLTKLGLFFLFQVKL